jgi:U3 small nucleolar ribonucleoprotein protein IMP3
MRQLKHHEQKLLKKVNFLAWKNEHNQRELQVRSRGVVCQACVFVGTPL